MRFLTTLLLVALSAAVSAQPRGTVDTRLSVELTEARPGDSVWVAVSLTPEPGWHTYWLNPGDAGLATRLNWTLPDSISNGEIVWPTPEAHREGDEIVTYGYGATHHLLTKLTIADEAPTGVADIAVKARWLTCKDICIPGSATLTGALTIGAAQLPADDASAALFAEARSAVPVPVDSSIGAFAASGDDGLQFRFDLPQEHAERTTHAEFFVHNTNLVNHAAPARWSRAGSELVLGMATHPAYIDLPQAVSGVLVLHSEHGATAYDVGLTPGTAVASAGTPLGAQPATQTPPRHYNLLWILLLAFAGGATLNLMPCVFPVLALKAFGISRAHNAHARRLESLAYAGGVIISFVSVAAVLLALRAGGAALGWGFQLQNPVVVGVLASFMALFTLALAGWTEIGMQFMGIGENLTHRDGLSGAFFTGVLAVVVASPCTAPFMGTALGYAITQPSFVALSVFAALGLGLASPFLLISWVPALAKRLPRPGPWMNKFKHVMAVPLGLTAIWLFWVLFRQASVPGLLTAVTATVLLAIASRQTAAKGALLRPAPALVVAAIGLGLFALPTLRTTDHTGDPVDTEALWQPYSPESLADLRAQERVVLVNFTADWCITCIVNERTALHSAAATDAIDSHDVALLKGDWTNYDPTITDALATFGRNGVPLYLVYPANGGEPHVLPQLLTASAVIEAIAAAAR